LLFADNFFLLASSEQDFKDTFFSAACHQDGRKISTKKTYVVSLYRNPGKCTLQVSNNTLQQVENLKYLRIMFTSGERRNKEINIRIGKSSAFLREFFAS